MANIAHTIELLADCPCEITPMLWGAQGSGKTEIIRQLADEYWHLPCIELQGGQLADIGDLLGLQQIIEVVGDDGRKYKQSDWCLPFWMPKTGKPICLFLDELNRASPTILRAMMQIGNDHKLLNYTLPEGSRVICACNPADSTGDFDVEEFDDAQKDRFWHLKFDPGVDEWLYWAKTRGNVLSVIIDYIDANPLDLDPYTLTQTTGAGAAGSDGFPALQSRRSWKRLSDWLTKLLNKNPDRLKGLEGKDLIENIAMGFVGHGIASRFASFFEQHGIGLTPRVILEAEERDWKELDKQIKNMELAETVKFGGAICNFLFEVQDSLVFDPETIASLQAKLGDKFTKNDKINPKGRAYALNFYNYIKRIPPEAAAQLCANVIDGARKRHERWVGAISLGNDDLMEFMCKMANYSSNV